MLELKLGQSDGSGCSQIPRGSENLDTGVVNTQQMFQAEWPSGPPLPCLRVTGSNMDSTLTRWSRQSAFRSSTSMSESEGGNMDRSLAPLMVANTYRMERVRLGIGFGRSKYLYSGIRIMRTTPACHLSRYSVHAKKATSQRNKINELKLKLSIFYSTGTLQY